MAAVDHPVLSPVCAGSGSAGHALVRARVRGVVAAMVFPSGRWWRPGAGRGLWSGGWLQADLALMAGEVELSGQGGLAEDGGEFCCLGSLSVPFGLDGRKH